MLSPSRERSRFRANMPREAWKHGLEPRVRVQRWRARQDLAEGMRRYVEKTAAPGSPEAIAAWSAWAFWLGAGYSRNHPNVPAPDHSGPWGITTIIEYL